MDGLIGVDEDDDEDEEEEDEEEEGVLLVEVGVGVLPLASVWLFLLISVLGVKGAEKKVMSVRISIGSLVPRNATMTVFLLISWRIIAQA